MGGSLGYLGGSPGGDGTGAKTATSGPRCLSRWETDLLSTGRFISDDVIALSAPLGCFCRGSNCGG